MKALLKKTLDNSKENVLKLLDNKNTKTLIVTSNPEIYINALNNNKIYDLLMNENVLVIPDSVSVGYSLKKVFGVNIKPTPGIDLLVEILKKANVLKKSIYLYGAKEEVNIKFKKYVKNNYKNIKIVGSKHGYVKDIESVKKDIIKKKPELIVCALGVPKQELFLYDLMKELEKGLFIGVGGSFDVLSGSIKRAPKVFRKLKLEWAYRIITQPKRLKRFFKYNVKFVKIIRKCDKND